ncbi:hypothetical protein MSAN_02094500 [Mycena sanguinolenta]|uniref:HNH nuclease domain-containing protein n=1 Tax=Mycena sanguinolenta TaxID=230812 RepID=A0A8H6XI45_9AGAR|nr:hypothetical protein MSAN_02094500 [Mycena sanguinolenta]
MSSLILPAITARPLKNPLPLLDTNSLVGIYHPKVDSGPPILRFRAFPSKPDSGVVGVPLGVVLDACFVVAGNQPGELHLCAPPHERVAGDESDPDGLLVPGMYHFVVVQAGGGLDYNYHLCESFAAWAPPVEIPTRWLGGEAVRAPPPPNISDISAAVKSDDECPKPQRNGFFFHYRVLMGYGGDPDEDLNSVRNQVTLRADLNGQGIDQGLFLFAPYADRVVAVFAKTMGQDLAHEYHLRAVDFPTRIRRGYLFIRFAWNVFKFLSPGLAAAAAAIRSPEKRPDGGGFLKRKRTDDTGSRSKKSKKGGTGSGGARKQEDVGGTDNGGGGGGDGGAEEDIGGTGDGEGSLLTEDRESAPKTEDEDEAQLAVFETLDAALKTRPLTVDDLEAGRYPGFARIKRLEREYRRAHPQVSTVGDPRVWEGR